MQQHQILGEESIKVAVLHLRGKAYASWIFEYFSLRNVNISSYANFTKALVKRFDKNIHETPMVEVNQKNQVKPLHKNLHHTFPEEKSSSHILEQESMEISFPKRDPIIGGFPIHIVEIEGNSTVSSRYYLVPHVEEGGPLAPSRGMLASLQESPQDLMCRDQGTNHVILVPLLKRCETMETQGEGRENT